MHPYANEAIEYAKDVMARYSIAGATDDEQRQIVQLLALAYLDGQSTGMDTIRALYEPTPLASRKAPEIVSWECQHASRVTAANKPTWNCLTALDRHEICDWRTE